MTVIIWSKDSQISILPNLPGTLGYIDVCHRNNGELLDNNAHKSLKRKVYSDDGGHRGDAFAVVCCVFLSA
jgi:hypothetical protein